MTAAIRIAILIIATAAGAAQAEQGDRPLVAEFRQIRPAVPAPAAEQRLSFRAFGTDWRLDLADNEALLEALPDPMRRALAARGHRFLRGTVSGKPGSWARLNWIGGRLSGGFFDGRELYLIDRAGDLGAAGRRGTRPDDTIVFRFSDLDLERFIDPGAIAAPDARSPGTRTSGARTSDAAAGDFNRFIGHLQEIAALQGSAMMAMPVTIVTDTGFNSRYGSNTAAVVAGRLNFVDGIFTGQLGTGIVLWHHKLLADDANLVATDAGTLLEQFRQFMNGGAGRDIPFRGIAHLFSGRIFDGSTVGTAFFSPDGSVLCRRSAGLGVDQDLTSGETISALVFAHEAGHNFNARHDDNTEFCPSGTLQGIMASTINGSQQFSQCSLDVMGPTAAEASCLVESTVADDVFSDSFENR
ncbi:MAG: M12 family metallo-peptidase [Wenzhouxiangellaceae bacterium]|nr:M12 family metallo-peptidase [Wenzhouxiangellaceae bacterium]